MPPKKNGHHFFNDFYQLRVLSEHAPARREGARPGQSRDGNEQHYLEQQAESFAHAAVILGAVVVAHNGLRASCVMPWMGMTSICITLCIMVMLPTYGRRRSAAARRST